MKKISILIGFSVLTVFLTGCVTGRRVVPLPIPPAEQKAAATKGEIAVQSIVDSRQFVNKPPNPSTPSIKGDVAKLTPEQKAMFIGRQRNGYGMAMGDIVLPDGETVPKKVKELVQTAFVKRGFTISDKAGGANTADISVDEFWAWFTPGFASVSFESRVYCTFTVRREGTESKFSIQGYGKNTGQVAKNSNWQLAYKRAFEDFLKKLDAELATRGF